MTRRRTILAAGFPITVVATLLVLGWWWDEEPPGSLPRIQGHLHTENYARVRAGMSQAEVEELLGGPPGNYGRRSDAHCIVTSEAYRSPPDSVEHFWCDDHNRFEIYFDDAGRVVGHHWRGGYSQLSPAELRELYGPWWRDLPRNWLGNCLVILVCTLSFWLVAREGRG